MNAIIYTRVSTSDQAEDNNSLASQEEQCKIFAQRQGYSVLKVFVERGESAKNTNRTKLKELIKYCITNKKNIDVVIIWRYNRLSRVLKDQIDLINQFKTLKIDVLSATETNEKSAAGNLMRNIIGSFSQYDNEQKAEVVTTNMKKALKDGYWQWCPPKGYMKNGKNLVPHPKYAPVIKKVFEKFATGLYKQTDFIKIFKKAGIKANGNFIGRTLRNSLYCGVIRHEWLEHSVKGKIEPIISEELFNKVQEILDGKKPQVTGYNRNNPDFPLRQFLTCPNCNQPLTGGWSKGNAKNKFPYYHCYNKDCSCKLRVRADIVNKIFPEYLKTIKPEPHLLELYKAVLKDVFKMNTKEHKSHIDCLNRRLSQAQERKDKLLDMYMDEKVSEVDYRRKSELLENTIKEIREELFQTPPLEEDFNAYIDYAFSVIANVDKMWANGSLDLKQRLQRLIFPQGLTYDLETFRTVGIANIFTKIGALKAPYNEMVLPRGFESGIQ